MNQKPRVAFVDQTNTGCSQLAESLAKWYGRDVIESYSAGFEPGEAIDAGAADAMQTIYEVDLRQEYTPKPVSQLPPVDIIICLQPLSHDFSAQYIESWDCPVQEEPDYPELIDYLAEKVRYLIDLIIRGRYPLEQPEKEAE